MLTTGKHMQDKVHFLVRDADRREGEVPVEFPYLIRGNFPKMVYIS